MRYWNRIPWILAAFLLPTMAVGEQTSPDRVTVAFSDASRPGTVKADVRSGAITVRAYEGSEVIIVATTRGESPRGRQPEEAAGMRRIQSQGSGLEVVEQNNVIEIETASFRHSVDLDIQVPRRTSLHLQTVNNGDVKVENVHGDHEVEALNGRVTLTGISGSAVVHALNGKIHVVLTELTPGKSMSFSSMNGDIDVTLPAALKANAIMQSDNGEIYTDFDVKLDSSTGVPAVEDSRSKGGKYRFRLEKGIRGTINGGGPEIRFKTFNGNIYIRRAGSD